MTEEMFTAIVTGIVGLAVGSFLNVVIYRFPRGLSLVRPGSACPECKQPIRALENVPVLSYLLLRGRCRNCGVRISVRYPVVELLTAGLFAGAALRFERLEEVAFVCAASAVLVALAYIDLDHRRVPNRIVLPSTAVAAVWVLGASLALGTSEPALNAFASAFAGFVVMFLMAVVSGGLGFGDVKLTAFIGFAAGRFGWEAFLLGMFWGFMAGGLISVALLLARRRGRKDAIPFAPMLCFGALVGMFAGPAPVRAWLGL